MLITLRKFVILNGEIVPEAVDKKFCRLDIHLKVNGQYIDIEMQVSDKGNFAERLLVYWSKVFSGALNSGDDYAVVPKAILISFINFDLFECEEYYSEFVSMEKHRYELLTDKMSIFVFELGKLPKEVDVSNMLELYLRVFKADTEEELVKAVRERHKRGCGAVKIMASGGQLTPGTLPERESYNVQLINAAVQEAHRLGMVSLAHCLTTSSMVNALKGGVMSIEHAACFVRNKTNKLLERVYEEKIMEEFRGDGRWFMNGISNNYHYLDHARENRAAATERELFLLEQEERECKIFGKYVELGFRPVIGTDAGTGTTYFDETWLECFILASRCGMNTADIIEAATINGASCLGLADETGKIEAGLSADIIALEEDPLKDIMALKNPAKVICRGEDV